jgi:thioesterase domain-containing protein
MSVGALLAELRRRDIGVWVEGDNLRCSAPAGALTPELTADLRLRKREIVELLRGAEAAGSQARAVVPLQPRGSRTPIFGIPGHNGDVFCYRTFAARLGNDQPFYGLQPPGADDHAEPMRDTAQLAAYLADQLRQVCPDGPYILAGFCAGGSVAFELARRLREQGARVEFVAMFTSPYPTAFRRWPALRTWAAQRLRHHRAELARRSWRGRLGYLRERWLAFRARRGAPPTAMTDPVMVRRARVEEATVLGLRRYRPRPTDVRLRLFTPDNAFRSHDHTMLRWRSVAPDSLEYPGPTGGDGNTMLLEPQVDATLRSFEHCLRECTGVTPGRVGAMSRSTTAPRAPLLGSGVG